MSHATLEMNGKKFMLVPEREYREKFQRNELPAFPYPDAEGNMPALAFGRVAIARELIKRREAVDCSQKGLAAAAGVRVETLNRIENARVTPDTATIVKIDKALKRLERVKK